MPAPLLALAAVVLAAVAGFSQARPQPDVLVQLVPGSGGAAAALREAGGELIAPELRLYRLDADAAGRVVPGLERRGAVAHVQPDLSAGTLAVAARAADEPLFADEWWRAAVRVDGLTPPGPGRPVTIVDSGIDVTHPEFAGRPNTFTLNEQQPQPLGGQHGTAVASLAAAPVNGVGISGIYPDAVLRSWDAAVGDGVELRTGDIVDGILTAARAGPGVINLSLGGDRDDLIEQAVNAAVARGSLVVAASGNDGERGNALGFPAGLPHVLTVAATDRSNQVAVFSSSSRYVDLAAPGDDLVVASARERGWRTGSGTSFAAPLVSGAAAWVWTARPELDATQLFEVLRRSARDTGPPGRDPASGFGLLDVTSALTYPAPIPDPLEPNDDVQFVQPGGFHANGLPPVTSKSRSSASLSARIDAWEDPRDVYRVWLPAGRATRVVLTSAVDVDLTVWTGRATSVLQRPDRSRIGASVTSGTGDERVDLPAGTAGRWAYVAVRPAKGVTEATYRLTVRAR